MPRNTGFFSHDITPLVKFEVLLVVVTKTLDGVSTFVLLSSGDAAESLFYTRYLIDVLGLAPGVLVATVTGVVFVVVVGEVGARICAFNRRLLGIDEPKYPCIPYHTTYVVASGVFTYAVLWNLSLIRF
ncbi:MAG: hypothetical protein SV760_01560 [Halobacteria archaeon]|nr:hypothetical protein [Halobacteria archaeon]